MSRTFVLLLSSLLLSAAACAEEGLDRHDIRLRLDPASSHLAGTSRLETDWRRKLSFQLRPELELSRVTCGDVDLTGRVRSARGSEEGLRDLRLPRSCAGEDGRVVLDFAFQGVIRDEPTQEPSLHFVTGARSTGIVSEQGAFLTGGTGFHPEPSGMALFDLVVDVPTGWAVASQGRVVDPAEPPAEGRALFAFEAELPSDGLALSAGPYQVRGRRHGETLVRTFFFDDDEERSELFLDAVISYLDRFEALLGPYPHSKFDVVENFFTTGYGFPSYTLLGQNVIAMGSRALRPGYVDHEVAHCWWGNGVYVDPKGGNWCEGLTTYVANYLGAESKGDEAALAHRRKVSQRYAVDVAPGADFPPRDFIWKTDDAGASIGYGKISMIFHQLRRELGDELFWKGLRELVRAGLGRQASWVDIEAAFETVSGRELGGFFSQWIGRAGLPRLVLADLRQEGGRVVGLVRQEGEHYELEVDLAVTGADGEQRRERLAVSGAETPFAIDAPGRAVAVELDPDWHLPRRVPQDELAPSLARTLAAKSSGHGLILAYPIAAADASKELRERAEAYRALAEAAAEQHGGEALPALSVAEAEWNGSSLVLFGGPDENPLTQKVLGELLEAGFDPTGEGFRAGSKRWLEEGDALLATIAHPARAGASVSVYIPNGDRALATGRYIFFYGWDSWAALRNGRAMERGTNWPDTSATRVVLGGSKGETGTSARLRETLEQLTRPELEGRDAGTQASRRTAEEIEKAMREAGLDAWDPRGFGHVFYWFLRDLNRQPKLFLERRDRTSATFDCTPAAYWLPVPSSLLESTGSLEMTDEPVNEPILVPFPEGLVLAGTLDSPSFRGLDLRGAAAVVVDDSAFPPPEDRGGRARYEAERTKRYFELLSEVRRQEGETLIVIRPRDEAPFFPALASYPSLDGERDPRLAALAAEGGPRSVARALSGRSARTGVPTVPVRLAFAGAELLEALRAEGAVRAGQRAWRGTYIDLRMRVSTERVFDRNVVGLTRGMRRLGEGLVLVGAHHDGVGLGADGGIRQGAVDNASGVAVMLELARRLAADPPPLTVAFASYGAEEWGLIGSRSLAASWPGHWPLRAVVNIDSVGQRGAKLHVIGESREPALGETILSAVRAEGFELGANIDRYADRDGSDHWPWAEAGAPAVDVFQADYRTLNGPKDRLELVDVDALARLVDALESAIRKLASGADS